VSDIVYGNKAGTYNQYGDQTINHNQGSASPAEVDAAIAELRAMIAQLTRQGAVAADGSVTDPGAVVAAVEENPGRLRALAAAVGRGAKDAVLSVVQDGVASFVVALVSRM
jgi:hypothetical protein